MYKWHWKCYNCRTTWPHNFKFRKIHKVTKTPECPLCKCHLVSRTTRI